jgi:hypothetical protein
VENDGPGAALAPVGETLKHRRPAVPQRFHSGAAPAGRTTGICAVGQCAALTSWRNTTSGATRRSTACERSRPTKWSPSPAVARPVLPPSRGAGNDRRRRVGGSPDRRRSSTVDSLQRKIETYALDRHDVAFSAAPNPVTRPVAMSDDLPIWAARGRVPVRPSGAGRVARPSRRPSSWRVLGRTFAARCGPDRCGRRASAVGIVPVGGTGSPAGAGHGGTPVRRFADARR